MHSLRLATKMICMIVRRCYSWPFTSNGLTHYDLLLRIKNYEVLCLFSYKHFLDPPVLLEIVVLARRRVTPHVMLSVIGSVQGRRGLEIF
jgi:hypothetical protein